MSRRERWRRVLETELRRWEQMPIEKLLSCLFEKEDVYQVQLDSIAYQVEVHLLENTEEYIHVSVSVDDGSLPASIFPVSSSLIRVKDEKRESQSIKPNA
jgi:hypothetical protein